MAKHALVSTSCRGFVDVVTALVKVCVGSFGTINFLLGAVCVK